MRIVVLCLTLVAAMCVALADGSAPVAPIDGQVTPQSSAVSIDESGLSVTFLADGEDYGLGFGSNLSRDGPWRTDVWAIFQPEDNRQLAAATTIGYETNLNSLLSGLLSLVGVQVDNPSLAKVCVTPMVGVLQDLTTGADGSRRTRLVFGGQVTIKLN